MRLDLETRRSIATDLSRLSRYETLVLATACSNEAIRDLLGAIASSWPDPHEQLARDARIQRHLQQEGD